MSHYLGYILAAYVVVFGSLFWVGWRRMKRFAQLKKQILTQECQ